MDEARLNHRLEMLAIFFSVGFGFIEAAVDLLVLGLMAFRQPFDFRFQIFDQDSSVTIFFLGLVEPGVDAVESSFVSVESVIDTVKSRVVAVESVIDTAKSRVVALQAVIDTVQPGIDVAELGLQVIPSVTVLFLSFVNPGIKADNPVIKADNPVINADNPVIKAVNPSIHVAEFGLQVVHQLAILGHDFSSMGRWMIVARRNDAFTHIKDVKTSVLLPLTAKFFSDLGRVTLASP